MADIPTLTEVLPAGVSQLVHSKSFQQEVIPTTTLSLDAPAGTIHRMVCDTFRGSMGIVRGLWSRHHGPGGYVSTADIAKTVIELEDVPENSLLRQHLSPRDTHHKDTFMISVNGMDFGDLKAGQILELLLEGFLNNAPRGVSRLMMIRNVLVRPIGLRTSPLGCPVSSLLSDDRTHLFADRYPVLDQHVAEDGSHAQVVLGAWDKHLIFRSCIGVERVGPNHVNLTLGTAVRCKNLFGHFYMSAISLVHRKYISPTMILRAADYLVSKIN